jgi:hypothetical protein
MSKDIVKRKSLSSEDKYKILSSYAEGVPVETIAASVSRDTAYTSDFIRKTLKAMNTIKETNDMVRLSKSPSIRMKQLGSTPTKFLTSTFISKAEDTAEIYAYYFVQTGDNKFALEQAGLDMGIAKHLPKGTKNYVYKVRGQFLRNMPGIATFIKEAQDQKLLEMDVSKPQVQSELIQQIAELKILSVDDPRYRKDLLKAIELLGKTVIAFTDSVHVEEASAKTGLEIRMEKAKGEVYEAKSTEET